MKRNLLLFPAFGALDPFVLHLDEAIEPLRVSLTLRDCQRHIVASEFLAKATVR